jgi:hypothetical protein
MGRAYVAWFDRADDLQLGFSTGWESCGSTNCGRGESCRPRPDGSDLTAREVERFTMWDMLQTQLGGLSFLNASMPQ